MTAGPDSFQDVFRDIMSNFAASVTVVTSSAGDRHHGLTVSAFTSVSLDPPLVLCVFFKHRDPSGLPGEKKSICGSSELPFLQLINEMWKAFDSKYGLNTL